MSRDRQMAENIRSVADQAEASANAVFALVVHAQQQEAYEHSALYARIAGFLDAGVAALKSAADLMDPQKTEFDGPGSDR